VRLGDTINRDGKRVAFVSAKPESIRRPEEDRQGMEPLEVEGIRGGPEVF